MDRIKIGEFVFGVDNGGLLITFGNDEQRRFEPEESRKLLAYLTEHQSEFDGAIKHEEPKFGSKEWENQQLERAFRNMPD